MPLFLLANWRWIAGALLVLGLVLAYQHQISKAYDRGYAKASAEWQDKWVKAVNAANARERQRDTELATAINQVKQDAKNRIDQANATSGRERLAAERLREHIASLATGAAGESAGTLPAGDAASRIANIAVQCVAEYQRLAEVARRGLEAGRTCERQYQAIEEAVNRP
jgi:hypothetical protein